MAVHAGEDFADVLDGLCQISSAIDGCALGAGDGIGHGLALTTAPRAAKSPHYAMIPRGTHHDSLCWLYDRIEKNDARDDCLWASPLLRSMIEESGREIYQAIDTQVAYAPYDDFLWAWRHKTHPLERDRQDVLGLRKDLAVLEDFSGCGPPQPAENDSTRPEAPATRKSHSLGTAELARPDQRKAYRD